MPDSNRPADRHARGDGAPEFEEDPLVELARIVSEGSGGYQRRQDAAPEPQSLDPVPSQPRHELSHWSDEPLRGSVEEAHHEEPATEGELYQEDDGQGTVPEYSPYGAEEPAYEEPEYERAPEAYEDSYQAEQTVQQYTEPAPYADHAYSAPQHGEPVTQPDEGYSAEPDNAPASYDDGYGQAHEPEELVEQAPQGDATAGFEDELRSAFDISIGGRARFEQEPSAEQPAGAEGEPSAAEDDFDDLFVDEARSAPSAAATSSVEPQAPHYEVARERAPAEERYERDVGQEGDYYEEEKPPEGGYDLDAVARAMQESDPALTGHGVLPPHPEAETRAAPEGRGKRRGLAVAVAIVGLAVVGGAAFALIDFGDSGVDIGPPPVIAAQEGDLKIYPATEEPKEQTQSKLIYDRVRGVESTGEERLVLPDETPVASLPPAPETTEPAATDGTTRTVAPKRVRTVIVRPDGTIISGSDGVEDTAETAALSEPALPSTLGETAAPGLPDTTTPPASTPDLARLSGVQSAAPASTAAPGATPQQPREEAADRTAPEAAPVQGEAVLPRAKPDAPRTVVASAPAATSGQASADQSDGGPLDLTSQQQAGAPPRPSAAATQPQRSQPAASSSGSIPAGAYIVQVSSQRTEDQARQAFEGLQGRFPSVLGSVTPVIQRADLGDRGVFYRVRIPASSRDEAIGLCENLKAAGGDCFVRRN
ncbi:SPOR domain-containing protein [Rhizobiales bacterium]|uniref:SPOR domain-containing protein n=1 Tax=Hongsoonwoonella zoysiae TaxID=2821844 RepID=UPI00155F79E7|nr:SPOR domain-containing protein [Hongsoonwoonella zoysiae]NRG18873.1 SPOR domain-containing protein [Hongsoonwoonella zoysiae]